MKPRMAFLVYKSLKKSRRKNDSFYGNSNFGARVVRDILERSGYEVDLCVPENANRYDVVLVSLTSTHDVFALYRSVYKLDAWKQDKRTFKVWAGGFGMQNPTAIKDYVDWSFFGRVDDWLCDIAAQLIKDGYAEHEGLMDMERLNPVKIVQTKQLYGERVEGLKTVYGNDFAEEFTGCPLKCKFCHYTFARKYQDNRTEHKGSYVQTSLTGGGTPELTWDQLLTYNKKAGRVRVAIDGCSERLRKLYGKGFITNERIIQGVENMGSFEGNTVLLVYNIGNFPYETQDDRDEIEDVLQRCNPKNNVVFVLYTTPFRPSLATPMQWEGVNVEYDWSKHRARVICDKPKFRAIHAFDLETPYSHFTSVMAERFEDKHKDVFHQIATNKKLDSLRSKDKMRIIFKNYDVDWVLAERDIGTPPPAPFLSSYLPDETLRKIATKMRRQARVSVGNSIIKKNGKE